MDAWRLLTDLYEPRQRGRQHQRFGELIRPKKDVIAQIEKWEREVREYLGRFKRQIDEDCKLNTLIHFAPEAVREHIYVNSHKYEKYDAVREKILSYVAAKSSTALMDERKAMDVDALAKRLLNALEKGKGKPFNFRPTFFERRIMERKRAAEVQAEKDRKRAADEAEALRKAQEREQRELEAKRRMDEVARQEMELLEARAMPLRNYLMENVIPTLTTGLLEVCKIQPDDPVDFLAEWLFKNNPEDS